jgi:thiosulfate dehydrogenase [quinone] large subunit
VSPASAAARSLALIRIVVGGWFLKTMVTKVSWVMLGILPVPVASSRWIGFLPHRLAEYAQNNPLGWYRDFLLNVAIPHAPVFAWLTAFGEVCVGLALVLGVFTEFAAGIGLLLTLSYALATFHLGMAQQGFHLVLATCMVAFMSGHAGLVWGLDGILRNRSWAHARPVIA